MEKEKLAPKVRVPRGVSGQVLPVKFWNLGLLEFIPNGHVMNSAWPCHSSRECVEIYVRVVLRWHPDPTVLGKFKVAQQSVWLWWLNDESYSELRQDSQVFKNKTLPIPGLSSVANVSYVICKNWSNYQRKVGGKFSRNSLRISPAAGSYWKPLGLSHTR